MKDNNFSALFANFLMFNYINKYAEEMYSFLPLIKLDYMDQNSIDQCGKNVLLSMMKSLYSPNYSCWGTIKGQKEGKGNNFSAPIPSIFPC